mmetsp:Transcript_5076/g.11206  ORF Transcript_5076/g.11206 Transcript_5076/m.11206 type:complete len:220 (-) Transcript_5076:555-1214(-)
MATGTTFSNSMPFGFAGISPTEFTKSFSRLKRPTSALGGAFTFFLNGRSRKAATNWGPTLGHRLKAVNESLTASLHRALASPSLSTSAGIRGLSMAGCRSALRILEDEKNPGASTCRRFCEVKNTWAIFSVPAARFSTRAKAATSSRGSCWDARASASRASFWMAASRRFQALAYRHLVSHSPKQLICGWASFKTAAVSSSGALVNSTITASGTPLSVS